MPHSNEIRKILNSLTTINNSVINEDLSDTIDKVKNTFSKNLATNYTSQHEDEPSINDVKQNQENFDDQIEERAKNVFNVFKKDIEEASVEPTVGNTIKWLKGHKTINDPEMLSHAFKSIGLDVSSLLIQEPTKSESEPEMETDIEEPVDSSRIDTMMTKIKKMYDVNDENDFKKILAANIAEHKDWSDLELFKKSAKKFGEHNFSKKQQAEKAYDRVNRLYDLITSAGFVVDDEVKYKNILNKILTDNPELPDNELLKKTREKYGVDKIEKVKRPRIENIEDAVPESKQKPIDKKEGYEPTSIIVQDKNGRIIKAGSVVKIQIKKGSKQIFTHGKVLKLLSNDDNDIKIRVEIMGEDIGSTEETVSYDIHAWELINNPDRIVLVDSDEDDEQQEEKIYDSNGKLIDFDSIVIVKNMTNPSEKTISCTVEKIDVDSKNREYVELSDITGQMENKKVKFYTDPKDHRSGIFYMMDTDGTLGKTKYNITLSSSKRLRNSYRSRYNNILIEAKYNTLGILSDDQYYLLENAVKMTLMEETDVSEIELDDHELLGLFEILFYIVAAKRKGFDITSVKGKFKNEKSVQSYMNRMYRKMLDIKDKEEETPQEEQKKKYDDLYSKVMGKIPDKLREYVKPIGFNLISKRKNYPLGIAFMAVLYTVITEQKNKDVIEKYVKKLFNIITGGYVTDVAQTRSVTPPKPVQASSNASSKKEPLKTDLTADMKPLATTSDK